MNPTGINPGMLKCETSFPLAARGVRSGLPTQCGRSAALTRGFPGHPVRRLPTLRALRIGRWWLTLYPFNTMNK